MLQFTKELRKKNGAAIAAPSDRMQCALVFIHASFHALPGAYGAREDTWRGPQIAEEFKVYHWFWRAAIPCDISTTRIKGQALPVLVAQLLHAGVRSVARSSLQRFRQVAPR